METNKKPDSDKVLIAGFRKGNVRAFDAIYEKYSGRLYGFALMLLKNREDARDIVQETFLRVWQKRETIAENRTFKSFLFTVSYNIIVDHLRKRLNDKKYLEFLEKKFHFEKDSVENKAEYHLLEKQIQDVIAELPPRRKEIYLLSREKNLSNKEIAGRLQITVKTVETHLSLARKFLQSKLTGETLALMLLLFLFY